MGEMTVKGFAKKEITCDLVKYRFDFKAEGDSVPAAVDAVSEELERFLAELVKKGIEPDTFKVESNSARENYGDRPGYTAERSVSAVFHLNVPLLDAVMEFISDERFNVSWTESYLCSDIDEIHRELLTLAVEDSRKKAREIAACADMKLCGIKSITTSHGTEPEYRSAYSTDICAVREFSLADKLREPTREETETVEIVWLVEE